MDGEELPWEHREEEALPAVGLLMHLSISLNSRSGFSNPSNVPIVCTLPGHKGFQSSLPNHTSHGEPPAFPHIPAPIASLADGAVGTRNRGEHP